MKLLLPVLILVTGRLIITQIDNLMGISYAIQTSVWAVIAHDIIIGVYAALIWESIKWALRKK